MILELTEQERFALERMVEREVSDLGPEIHHTRTTDYRQDLKAEKRMLRELLQRLRTVEPAPGKPD
jgi:uncharacterized protein YjiS (DUF1127 family)